MSKIDFSYVDYLMSNKINSDINEYTSSDEFKPKRKNKSQKGGDVNYSKITTGSFPPLYFVEVSSDTSEEQDKSRAFQKKNNVNTNTVTIKEIMEERRSENKPFITL